jgi:hypothetical protein
MSKTLYIERGESGITIRRKDGSFFCCCDTEEPTCCMYPADKLGINYTAADLPDNLSLNWSDTDVVTVDKVGSGYAGGTVSILIENEKWVLRNTATGNARTIGRCLIREDDLVADQFEDSYFADVSYTILVGTPPYSLAYSDTVFRESLCAWYWEDDEGFNLYFALGFNDDKQRWEFAVRDEYLAVSVLFVKSGEQNSPVGNYGFDSAIRTIFTADYSYTEPVGGSGSVTIAVS